MTKAWHQAAACAGQPPELFFPIGENGPALIQAEQAVAVCRTCPVIDACLAWALDNRTADGIWGGTTERQRKSMRRRAGQVNRDRDLSPCGTTAAYYRHKKNREAIDDACREAIRVDAAAKKALEKKGAAA